MVDTTQAAHEPTLSDVLKEAWHAKFYILGAGILAALIAAAYISLSVPRYKAEMIVAPADGYALGDYASSSSVDRSIALPFWRPMEPEGVSTDYYRFVYTVREPSVAAILLKDKLVVKGVAEDDAGLRDLPADKWTPAMLSAYFAQRVKAEPVGATALRRLSYTHPDPAFAEAVLRKLHLVADQMIRRDRRRDSQARIDYLQKMLAKTNHPDHRKGITNLLMQQEHIQMLANLDEPYAAIVVEPPAASPRPAWPRPALIFPAAVLSGMLAGFGIGSLRRGLRA